MLSIEGYRVVIGAFYLRSGHNIYKSSTTFCCKYVVKRQAFHFSFFSFVATFYVHYTSPNFTDEP